VQLQKYGLAFNATSDKQRTFITNMDKILTRYPRVGPCVALYDAQSILAGQAPHRHAATQPYLLEAAIADVAP